MATFRRYITIFASFVVVWEVFFLLAADRHISSTSHHQDHGILPPLPPPGSLGGGFHRRPLQTNAAQYTPDYRHFNTSHPPILYASSPGSLPSLPDSTRVPRRVLISRNYTAHYSHWDHESDPPTLFVYNPSLVGVGPGVEGVVPTAAYLATFRVSSIHSCGFPTYEFWKYPVDYVGVALLDADLTIATVEGDSLDIVVDINAHLPNIFGGRIKFQDVRLFVLHGRVFLSSGVFLVPICVKVDGLASERHPSSPALCNGGGDTLEEIPALYRKNDRLRLFVTGDALRMKGADGKNFQFFSGDGGTSDATRNASSVLMEYWPHGPRVIHDLGDTIATHYASGSRSSKKQVVGVERVREITSEDRPDPVSKVAKSLDASLRTFIKRDRSSACCVRIPSKYYADLIPTLPPSSATKLKSLASIFVGIAHSKSRARMPSSQGDRYNYLSRLYAFSSSEPYELLARSGLFCFGFALQEDAPGRDVGVGSVYNERTKEKRLELNGKSYDCPNIHFVDSIVQKADDRDKVIVAYGVNDCVPRFVEISKRDFVTHLFSSDPTET